MGAVVAGVCVPRVSLSLGSRLSLSLHHLLGGHGAHNTVEEGAVAVDGGVSVVDSGVSIVNSRVGVGVGVGDRDHIIDRLSSFSISSIGVLHLVDGGVNHRLVGVVVGEHAVVGIQEVGVSISISSSLPFLATIETTIGTIRVGVVVVALVGPVAAVH